MCLYSYDYTATRVKKKIVSYKSVMFDSVTHDTDHDDVTQDIMQDHPDPGKNPLFISAFRSFLYKGGTLYYEPRFERKVEYRVIYEGFHSHLYIKEAEQECLDACYPATVMLRCEVPRGSYCYKGLTSDGEDMCSDFIIITGWKYPKEEKWHKLPYRKGWLRRGFEMRRLRRKKLICA